MNNEDKKERFTLWMKHSTFEKVEENYREDNCQKKSEFIENAVNFYCGYLKMNSSEPFLSTVLRETLKKLIKASDDRICKLIFKIAVELAITMNVVAANQGVDKEVLNSLRGECVKEVKKTNGIFTFDEADNWQKGLWLFETEKEIITMRWQTIRIEVKEKPKLVLFYLSRQETADGELMKEIEDNAQALKNLSFLSVVVESGEDDLNDSLYCLMKQNRRAVAEKLSA